MLNCIYDNFKANEYILSDGDTLITTQHLAIETHTRAAVYFNCGDGKIRKFLISHQGILEFNEPISFYGLYFEKDIEALITYTT